MIGVMAVPYVALGDSYAAGVGGGAEVDACWRAVDGYPVLVARALGVDVAYDACLGATTADVRAGQLGHLDPQTRYVSITIGGNDIGFVPVLVTAAEPAWLSDSDAAIDRALVILRRVLPGRLDGLYASIRKGAPNARIVATGYPRLFNGIDCNLATFFSAHEMVRLNAAADELASTIGAAAGRAGFDYLDVVAVFDGHAVCDPAEWLNGVNWPIQGSFHPNHDGHAAYARLVGQRLAAAAEVASAGEPRVVRGTSSRGSAPTFSLPDLLSPRSLAGAATYGIDPDEVAALARSVERPTLRPSRAEPADLEVYRRLHILDAEVARRRWPDRYNA
ncbi:MAG: SGNH/GDSL hydrolase family protein [Marmoricola sp.]